MAKILIVEDDQDLNRAYKIILEKSKHQVVTAFDGIDAQKKLKKFTPELILLDLLMPVQSGIEFLKSYDLKNKHPDVTVVVFTNLENAPEVEEAYSLGVKKCVIKAWTPPQGLLKVIKSVLEDETLAKKPA